jgi:hypothetical protein
MSHLVAKTHFEARAILLRQEQVLFEEAERKFLRSVECVRAAR